MNRQSVKPLVWGAVIGAVVIMILGFSWLGWVLGSTAERMATERANTAVTTALVGALVPQCLENYQHDPQRAKRLAELTALASYDQSDFLVKKTDWAKSSGGEPSRAVVEGCIEALLKTASK
jgi:hypothetical protein